MLYMVWVIDKSLPKHCGGGRGSDHHVWKGILYALLGIEAKERACSFSLRVQRFLSRIVATKPEIYVPIKFCAIKV